MLQSTINISPILKNMVKHSCLLFIVTSLSIQAEERGGLLLNTGVSTAYTDNVLNNINERSDTAVILTPDAKFLALSGKHKFAVGYKGKLVNYTKDRELSYNDHSFALGAKLDHSHKLSTEFKLGIDKKIEAPGSTNSSTLTLTDFNKYTNTSALAKIYYGQISSIGQIVIDYKFGDRKYTNNQQAFRNVEQHQFTATFFYRIAPKTRLLFLASASEFTYDDQQLANNLVFNQSSSQNIYLTGVEWQATGKTTGLFKIGYQNKNYDDVRFDDISGLSYNLDMIYKPNTYTQIKLGALRQTSESAQLNEGGFLSTTYSLSALHKIMARTTVTARFSTNNDDIVSRNNRTDKSRTIELGAKHSLRKWLDVALNYKYQEKTSNIEQFNYDSNAIELTFTTAFK